MEDFIQMAEGTMKRIVAFRLNPGTDVLKGLERVCIEKDIKNGVILSAIGSLETVCFCNPIALPEKKAGYGYGEVTTLMDPIELTSAAGMICHDDTGEIQLHVHISLSDAYGNGHGGHLVEGTKVLLTTDMVIAELEGLVMGRAYDEDLELPLFSPRQA